MDASVKIFGKERFDAGYDPHYCILASRQL